MQAVTPKLIWIVLLNIDGLLIVLQLIDIVVKE